MKSSSERVEGDKIALIKVNIFNIGRFYIDKQ